MTNQPTPKHYDIIGDIHGHADQLCKLLELLGYEQRNGIYRHRERRAVFVGDFIDRGPKIRETLSIVKGMADAGSALAVMGNHELNAIFYHTSDGNGSYLRPHSTKNVIQHQATLAQFENHQDEFQSYLEWFKRLPLYLEIDGIRVVHAAWNNAAVAIVRNHSFQDQHFLYAAARKGSPEHRAVEMLLKGQELSLPDGYIFDDKEGTRRREIRVKWWLRNETLTYRDLALPDSDTVPALQVPVDMRGGLVGYPLAEPPVFVGHYWLPPARPMPAAPNVAILDYSVAKGGFLTAYRWSGEQELDARNFVATANRKSAASLSNCAYVLSNN